MACSKKKKDNFGHAVFKKFAIPGIGSSNNLKTFAVLE